MKIKLCLLALLGLWTLDSGLGTLHAQTMGMNAKITSAEPKTNNFMWVTLTTGTAVAASSTNLSFTAATFYGYKAVANNAAPTANTAAAYIGFKDPAGVLVSAGTPALVDTIAANSFLAIARIGTKYNLADVYLLGTTGDKVLIVFQQ